MTEDRLFIYPKDYARITGKSEETCRKQLRRYRKALGVDRPLTVTEISEKLRISEREILARMR